MKPSEQPAESPGWAANPNYVIDWDLVPAKVSVSFNGKVVAESDQVRVMYELGHAPVYYFPKSALNPQFFEKVAAIWTEPFAAGVIVAVPTSTPCAFFNVAVAFCGA